MPCCTYLSDNQCRALVSDDEINSLLADVCRVTGEDWRVCETVREVRRWFRTPKVVKLYELLHETHAPEFQSINFYRPDREDGWSINLNNSAAHVAAYLYGILAGVQSGKESPQCEAKS